MAEIIESLGGQLRQVLGDPHERFSIGLQDELDPEVYKLLKGLDAEDAQLLKEAMMVLKGQRLRAEANDVPKDIEHMLADYRSARSIGKILKMVWVVIAAGTAAVFTIIKGLPDFLNLLRGWLK